MTDAQPDADPLELERRLDAPPREVWRMWTDADLFSSWYGPDGASIPEAELDVQPGGRRRVTMELQTPDGPMRMRFAGEFVTVEEPARLVYTEAMVDEDGNPQPGPGGHPTTTEVTVELTADGDGTALRLVHAGVPKDSPGAQGWAMALDSLRDRLGST